MPFRRNREEKGAIQRDGGKLSLYTTKGKRENHRIYSGTGEEGGRPV